MCATKIYQTACLVSSFKNDESLENKIIVIESSLILLWITKKWYRSSEMKIAIRNRLRAKRKCHREKKSDDTFVYNTTTSA